MRVSALGIALALILLTARAKAVRTCGEKQSIVQKLISYGSKAVAGAWPWHGALYHQESYACGVSILTEQVVITAAHCTIDPDSKQLLSADHVVIRVGVTNLGKPDWRMQQHAIRRIIRHEGYDEGTFEHDIALMQLNSEIEFNNYVQPICLWHGDSNLDKIVSKRGYLVGWGYDERFKYGIDLNEATMPIVSKKQCIDSDPNHYRMHYFDQKTFCAGYRNGTHAGPGDSGGGLFLRVGEYWVLRGIVSTTKTNQDTLAVDATSYVVFTDVSFYINWIKSHVTITTAPPRSLPPGDAGSRENLLNIANCGKDRYSSGTPEELKGYLNQYPWLAVIEYFNIHTHFLEDTCHAVLIHPSFLVTTSSCVQKKRYSSIQSIRLNDYRLDTANDIFVINGETTRTTAPRFSVQKLFVHPNYNNPVFANNIALIKLERPTTAIPICLPPAGSTLPVDRKLSIIGWKQNSRQEKPMIRNVVRLADFGACRRRYAAENFLLDSTGGQVCSTYSHDDDSDNCSHYMGSAPLQEVRNGPSRYFLAAISSFGHSNCRRDEFSDVFTSVAHYADWIQETVKRNER